MTKNAFLHWYTRWHQSCEKYWRDHFWESVIWLVIVAIGVFWRFYRLPETMMFQGDQGRDASTVAAIWREHDLVFIGPVTSVGNMYLGPFYYYFMLPFLWLTYPSPIGPVWAVGVINIVGIILLWVCGHKMIGERTAAVASGALALSAVAIAYSRFSWNPNLSAPVTILALYFTHRALTRSPKNWLWAALAAGILIQLHYVNLIVVAVMGVAWCWQWWSKHRDTTWQQRTHFWTLTASAAVIGLLTMVPLILFDWKHGWINVGALGSIFTQESSFADGSAGILLSLRGVFGRLAHLFASLTFPELETKLSPTGVNVYGLRVAYGVIICGLYSVFVWTRWRGKQNRWWRRLSTEELCGHFLLWTTMIISVVALAFYRHSVFDHYLLFFLPIGLAIQATLLTMWRSQRACWISVIIGATIFLYFNYPSHFLQPHAQTYKRTWELTREIVSSLPVGETFDFILIDSNRDLWGEHYRYFFDAQTKEILPHERFLEADNFLVIDETHSVALYDNPSYELVVFRNQPEATYELMLSHDDWPEVYRFFRQATDEAKPSLEMDTYEQN